MKISEAFGNSWHFAIENIVKKPLVWFGLSMFILLPSLSSLVVYESDDFVFPIIFIIISLFGWILMNALICKVLHGDKPDFSNIGKTLHRGLLFSLLLFIYILIPLIAWTFLMIGTSYEGVFSFSGLIILDFIFDIILSIIYNGFTFDMFALVLPLVFTLFLSIVCIAIVTPALVYSAKKDSSRVFFSNNMELNKVKNAEISDMVLKVGYGRYIASLFLVLLVGIIVYVILELLYLFLLSDASFETITIIYLVVKAFFYTFYAIVSAKFFAVIFSCTDDENKEVNILDF